ncbi:ROK family glucokinase [Dolosicoccus paucivorans]|uniref:Glucokinase n=1 Tax=Dolosicoccus paucivorans TaxID=84521 RepID=A0A1G8PHH5_9LACT|nr:ROK family glucokinase [Dolosicoccus paucivorans]PMB83823.1 glucokinase [Dolosicoccus paucivorans]PMC57980.1 glucokinase [Dolosicoccus paucivorans]SDI91892.1 glucokinase [Dolosicoccus paucivorans]
MNKYVVGIDLGGTSAKLAFVTPEGVIEHQWSLPTNTSDEGRYIVSEIIESIQKEIKHQEITQDQLIGIGMGSPGAINIDEGSVIGAYNLGWSQRQYVKDQFQKAFDLPFAIDNDANVAALGEQWQGAGDNQDNVVMITLGTGVGGGIVNEGKLVHGEGAAGEIGHLTVDRYYNFSCTCGKKGCVETLASATGIVNIAKELASLFEGESSLKDQLNDETATVDAKVIVDAAKESDPLGVEVMKEVGYFLGLTCSHVATLVNPSEIVLGGGVSHAGQYLLDLIQPYFEEMTFPQVIETTKISLAELGNDAGVLGASKIILQQINL